MVEPSERKRPHDDHENDRSDCVLPLRPRSSSIQSTFQKPRSSKVARRDDPPLVSESSSSSDHGEQDVIDLLDDSDTDDVGEEEGEEVEFVAETRKKRVTFHEIYHEVFYFKRYPSELAAPSLAAIDEGAADDSSGVHPSSEQTSRASGSRATADFTVLSSLHGRARRGLRRITKHDLRAAVKHGRREPAHPNPRTGEPRWKFVHDGLVYITDSTCRREITSYREEVRIAPHPLTVPMLERHSEVKRVLRDEPHLCTGHTYVVIDQSGSMRESDVDGFKSRSHAAYGTLSLEFVAEQLRQRSNPNDLFAESVTVIEMRAEGEVAFERVPFDWVLFNNLLKRPYVKRPSSHGNYCQSLSLVSEMILKEYNSLINDGADVGELPIFNLVFLSDGKPSDSTRGCDRDRSDTLQLLANTLKLKFNFYAMGVGAREADFQVLKSMCSHVQDHGGNGNFVHTGKSAVKLSQTFSQISSMVSSHRTTLLGDNNIPAANQRQKVQKDVTMRDTGKIVGKVMPSTKYVGKRFAISRYRFDIDLYRRGLPPFKEVDLATHGAEGIEIETKPFGKGSERLAYRFNEIAGEDEKCERVGKMMVAKNSVHLNENESKETFHQDFCLVQSTSYDLAQKFNTVVRNSPLLKAKEKELKPPPLSFMMCHVYSIKDKETNEESDYLVEKMLAGKFTKYNSNNGYVRDSSKGGSIELVCGEVKLEEFVQAFSHWVYEQSKHKMVVCDLQGVLNKELRHPEFQLTDPAICSRGGQRFGKTDTRLNGIRKFCSTHRCGLVCKGLGLTPMNKE